MVCLDVTDTLEGGASVTNVVDYTVHGLVAGVFTNIAQGQLSDTNPTVLYTAGAAISIVSITFVNTHSAAVTVDLYLDPTNAGTPRRMIPKAMTLGVGYSMHFDGQRCSILDSNGGIVTGVSVSDIAYAASWDGITTIAPSKNAVYDQMQLKLTGSYASAAEVTTGAEPAKAIAPDQLRASEATAAEITTGTVVKLITADQLLAAGLNLGAWITPAFNAAIFTAGGNQTWTVKAADVQTFAYQIIGKTMMLQVYLDSTSVGGTPDPVLSIVMPKSAAKKTRFPIVVYNAAYSISVATTTAGSSSLTIVCTPGGANWTASTNDTGVQFVIAFEIQ